MKTLNYGRSQCKGLFNEIRLDGGRGHWLTPLVSYCEQGCILPTYKTFCAYTWTHMRNSIPEPHTVLSPTFKPTLKSVCDRLFVRCIQQYTHAHTHTHTHTTHTHTQTKIKCTYKCGYRIEYIMEYKN